MQAVLLTGRAEIERAWVKSYHEIGRLINVHFLANEARADYGGQVYLKLGQRTGVSARTLRACAQFQRYFPIWQETAKLGWTQCMLLCQIVDPAARAKLTKKVKRKNWKTDELETRVRALNAAIDVETTPVGANDRASLPTHKPLVPQRGTPGVYRVANVDGALVVDLGFACYLDLTEDQAGSFKAGDLVQVDGAGRITPAPNATKADLFTYRVEIIKVVDGDTLWVKIYLRPRQWIKQKLRLRGLDCPEMKTPEGRAAKRFVDALVAKTTGVVINTTKPDKYDRYLADVFLNGQVKDVAGLVEPGPGSATPATVLAATDEIFLNNALLENGQAVRKEAWEFGDWEPELVR